MKPHHMQQMPQHFQQQQYHQASNPYEQQQERSASFSRKIGNRRRSNPHISDSANQESDQKYGRMIQNNNYMPDYYQKDLYMSGNPVILQNSQRYAMTAQQQQQQPYYQQQYLNHGYKQQNQTISGFRSATGGNQPLMIDVYPQIPMSVCGLQQQNPPYIQTPESLQSAPIMLGQTDQQTIQSNYSKKCISIYRRKLFNRQNQMDQTAEESGKARNASMSAGYSVPRNARMLDNSILIENQKVPSQKLNQTTIQNSRVMERTTSSGFYKRNKLRQPQNDNRQSQQQYSLMNGSILGMKQQAIKQQTQQQQPITIIQTPHVNNINNYHSYNINTMTFNHEYNTLSQKHPTNQLFNGTAGGIFEGFQIPAPPMVMLNPQLVTMSDDPAIAMASSQARMKYIYL